MFGILIGDDKTLLVRLACSQTAIAPSLWSFTLDFPATPCFTAPSDTERWQQMGDGFSGKAYLDPDALIPPHAPYKVLVFFSFSEPILRKLSGICDFLGGRLEVLLLESLRFP